MLQKHKKEHEKLQASLAKTPSLLTDLRAEIAAKQAEALKLQVQQTALHFQQLILQLAAGLQPMAMDGCPMPGVPGVFGVPVPGLECLPRPAPSAPRKGMVTWSQRHTYTVAHKATGIYMWTRRWATT